MAWSSPKTWSSGYVVLAADMNNIRDQLNATAPATLTAQGDIVIASGANALARLAKSTTSTQYLANTGTSNAPAWNEVALATGVSGTLPVGNGGTGQTSLTTGAILIGNSSSAVTMVTQTTKGQILIGDGSGAPQMLGVGSNDEVLTADSGETTGIKWSAAAGGGPDQAVASEIIGSSGVGSNVDKYIPPDLLFNHPTAPKVVASISSTGALQGTAVGVSSVTDNDNGDTITYFTVAFAALNYALVQGELALTNDLVRNAQGYSWAVGNWRTIVTVESGHGEDFGCSLVAYGAQ